MKYIATLLFLAIAAHAHALEARLVFQQDRTAQPDFTGTTNCGIVPDYKAPAGYTLPALLAEKPLYVTLKLGDQAFLVVADRRKKTDAFYTRLYVDVNGNKNLTDDAPLDTDLIASSATNKALFQNVNLTLSKGGKPYAYSFLISVAAEKPGLFSGCWGGDPNVFLAVSSACFYNSEVEVDGVKYSLRFADGNINGSFDDCDPPQFLNPGVAPHDALSISSVQEPPDWLTQPLAKKVMLGRALFDVDVNVPDGKLVLTPFAGETCPVKLAGAFEAMALRREEPNPEWIAMYRPAHELALPLGKYRLVDYRLFKKDEHGEKWTALGNGSRRGDAVEVLKGSDTVLPYGAPFSAQAIADPGGLQKTFWGGTHLTLGIGYFGAGNEEIRVYSDSMRTPEPPTFKAMKPDGEVVAQGAFEYG